jgi:toxin HigB-1
MIKSFKDKKTEKFYAGKFVKEFSISINMQWRICFKWYEDNPHEVCIEDYH